MKDSYIWVEDEVELLIKVAQNVLPGLVQKQIFHLPKSTPTPTPISNECS